MSKSMTITSAAIATGGAPVRQVEAASRRLGSAGGCAAIALAAALLLGSPPPALSQVGPTPVEGHVWAGCVLSGDAVTELTNSIISSDNADEGSDLDQENLEIAFVVVYALGERIIEVDEETVILTHDNDGQPLTAGGTTGPVICLNDALVLEETIGLGIEETSQTTPIPAVGATVDTLDAEDVFILRYLINGGGVGFDGTIEKVICHSVNDQTDCFRISPLLAD